MGIKTGKRQRVPGSKGWWIRFAFSLALQEKIIVSTSVCTGRSNCPPDSCTAMGSNLTMHSPTKPKTQTVRSGFGLYKGYEKDIFGIIAYEFELLQKSRRSRVYHQNEVLYIINSAGIAYHHCESTIQPTADDIHLR